MAESCLEQFIHFLIIKGLLHLSFAYTLVSSPFRSAENNSKSFLHFNCRNCQNVVQNKTTNGYDCKHKKSTCNLVLVQLFDDDNKAMALVIHAMPIHGCDSIASQCVNKTPNC